MIKKNIFCSCLSFVFSVALFSQTNDTLYTVSYGNKTNPAVIFLHDGPGLNAVPFEYTNAKLLAAKGFYVIVYDQHGTGRSKNDSVDYAFNYDGAIKGLDTVYQKYHIKKATLLAHGWGSTIAAYYTEKFPQKVKRVILISAAVDYQAMYQTIINNCHKYYTTISYDYGLHLLDSIQKMDSSSFDYANNCIANALYAGLYTQHERTVEATTLYNFVGSLKIVSKPEKKPLESFCRNEKVPLLNLTADWQKLVKAGIPVKGVYGKDDGLFDSNSLAEIKKIFGTGNVVMIDNSSHNVFMDQQKKFIATVVNFLVK